MLEIWFGTGVAGLCLAFALLLGGPEQRLHSAALGFFALMLVIALAQRRIYGRIIRELETQVEQLRGP